MDRKRKREGRRKKRRKEWEKEKMSEFHLLHQALCASLSSPSGSGVRHLYLHFASEGGGAQRGKTTLLITGGAKL